MLLTLVLITIVIFNNTNSNESNIISNTNKDKQVINNNMLTLMYETESGSGEYVETKDTTWPESGYIFNENLSGCENGGELEYNSGNNTINLLSNSSDRCYVYFDKYDGVWIDNVVATNITGSSVTLSVDATSENGNITKYYYALNDSEEYQTITSNVISINDLNKLTEYKISIYAVDSTNAKSNIYELTVSTTDENGPIVSFALINEITSNSISLTLEVNSKNEISKYYYSSNNGSSYVSSTSNSYTFSNLEKNTTYNISIYAEDKTGQKSDIYNFRITTENVLTLAEYIINNAYVDDGVNGLYYHDGKGNYTNADQEAEDNSYRYSGANPNNYILFANDLWRIIGVFDTEVKIIKNTSIGNYWWYGRQGVANASNYWGGDDLSLATTLNETYLNSLFLDFRNLISTHNWKSGGGSDLYLQNGTPKSAYNYEVGSNSSSTTYSAKIGLMYVSDYGYAANPDAWTTQMVYYNSSIATNNNWLLLGSTEWTISRCSNVSLQSFRIFGSGEVWRGSTRENGAVRPTIYLNSDVEYISGTGTQSDPFRIE